MEETEYDEGQIIEVTDEAFKDSWYTALVIETMDEIKGIKKKKILIEYEKLMAENGGLNRFKDAVDVDLVRPQPPQDEPNQNFQLNQFVDAFLANGWWKGRIFRVLGNDLYKVLMSSPTLEQQEIEFGVEKLRIHREFVDGEWVIPQSQDLDTIHNQDDAEETDGHEECMLSPACKKSKKQEMEEGSSSLIANPEGTEANKEEEVPSQRMKDKCQDLNDNDFSTPLEMPADPPAPICHENDDVIILDCDRSWEDQNIADLGISPVSSQGEHCDLSRNQSHLDFQVLEEGQSSLPSDDNVQEKETVERQGEMVSEYSTTAVCINNAPTAQSSVDENEVQKPFMSLARCSMSVNRGKTVEDQQCETHYEEVTLENGNRLFIKSHSMWKDLDSKVQSFPSMPQHPHFQPLQQLYEPLREGQALGHMVNFLNLVDKTSNAQITEPNRDFVNKIEAIRSLEVFGFNVEPIHDRLEELLRFKESRMLLDGRFEQFKGMMKNVKLEEESVDREINEIEKKLRGLEESLAKVNKECRMDEIALQIEGSSIATCERKLGDIEEKIMIAQQEYNDVASALW